MTSEEQTPRPATDDLAAEVMRAATAAAEAVPTGTAHDPPAVGDLYALTATAEHDVEWLLAAEDPARTGVFRAVAADTAPWVGSGDEELPEEEAVSPLVARCRHWLWLGPADLEAGSLTGRVSGEAAARVEERCRRVVEGGLDPSPLERETDADPEYDDRDRELTDAVRTLAGSRQKAPSAFPASDEPHPLRRWNRPRDARWAVAAAVLLIALLGWSGWVLSLQKQQIAELRRELAATRQPAVAVGEPLVIDMITRGTDALEPTAAGGQFHLQLAWSKPPLPRYRAVITRIDGDEPLLALGEFAVDDINQQATLSWGQGLLGPGLYELRLFDPDRDPPRLLRSIPLRIPVG